MLSSFKKKKKREKVFFIEFIYSARANTNRGEPIKIECLHVFRGIPAGFSVFQYNLRNVSNSVRTALVSIQRYVW